MERDQREAVVTLEYLQARVGTLEIVRRIRAIWQYSDADVGTRVAQLFAGCQRCLAPREVAIHCDDDSRIALELRKSLRLIGRESSA
jgi:hypothetical protein